MNRVTYQDLGIPEDHLFDSFHYAPSENVGVCVFRRQAPPSVNRIFWRRANDRIYAPIPVLEDNHSLDSCVPAPATGNVYYLVMQWRQIGKEDHEVGGYWVSLNRFNFESGKEEILLTEKEFAAVCGSEGSWIFKIVHITPEENEIDVIAATGKGPGSSEHREITPYAVHRLHLVKKQITHRFPLPSVFI